MEQRLLEDLCFASRTYASGIQRLVTSIHQTGNTLQLTGKYKKADKGGHTAE